jgi:hypothetical protein
MGQQQILIVILVVIIVALGVALAMQVFKTSYVNFEEDKYSQIMIETAEQFQVVYEKPEMLGGGGRHWTNVNFDDISCTFGEKASTNGRVCRAEDRSLILVLTDHGTYLGMNGVARIGGKGLGDMYTREMKIYPDSLVFLSDWIGH